MQQLRRCVEVDHQVRARVDVPQEQTVQPARERRRHEGIQIGGVEVREEVAIEDHDAPPAAVPTDEHLPVAR
jgi:hypothetical protein